MEKYIRQGLRGFLVPLSPWSWGASPSLCGCGHQPGSSLDPVFWGFYGDSLSRHDGSFTPFLGSPLSGGWTVGLKIPSFPSWKLPSCLILSGNRPPSGCPPRVSHLIRPKGTTVTQEFPRDLGALCQEAGAETNTYFFYYFTRSYLWNLNLFE